MEREANADIQWSPIPGRNPADLDSAFRTYSLPREIGQTNLIFYAFGLFALCNLAIDVATGLTEFIVLNGFFVFLALAGSSFMRRVLDYRLLTRAVNVIALFIIAALLAAKTTTAPDNWFVYFADILVITVMILALPIAVVTKVIYALVLVIVDSYTLNMTDFPRETILGVILMLAAATFFSAIIYIKMQQAHFTAFQGLRREQSVNAELRSAMTKIDTLHGLLPICANCKKVRDDNGYWEQIDEYIKDHSDVTISHSICPGCAKELYPDLEPGQDQSG